MPERKKILLVEDDPSLGYVIKDNLDLNGYDVTLCVDGLEGLSAFNNSIILSICAPTRTSGAATMR